MTSTSITQRAVASRANFAILLMCAACLPTSVIAEAGIPLASGPECTGRHLIRGLDAEPKNYRQNWRYRGVQISLLRSKNAEDLDSSLQGEHTQNERRARRIDGAAFAKLKRINASDTLLSYWHQVTVPGEVNYALVTNSSDSAVAYRLEYAADIADEEETVALLTGLAKSIQPRAQFEVPAQTGFCIYRGLIPDDGNDGYLERASGQTRMEKNGKKVKLSYSLQTSPSKASLLRSGSAMMIKATVDESNQSMLRWAERKLGWIQGAEFGFSGKQVGDNESQLYWRSHAKNEEKLPNLDVTFAADSDWPDLQVTKAWDQVINSLEPCLPCSGVRSLANYRPLVTEAKRPTKQPSEKSQKRIEKAQAEFEQKEAAANAGNSQAQFDLGQAYFQGDGVSKNDELAVEWIRKAAKNGHIKAMRSLSYAYTKGIGGLYDLEKSTHWLRQAAKAGHTASQFELGRRLSLGRYTAENDIEGAQWFEKAAESGHLSAMANLGYMYRVGDGVTRDFEQARRWLKKPAEAGDSFAQSHLGIIHHFGEGQAINANEAAKWFKKAAAQNDRYAQYYLATLYREGRGVPQDVKKAFELTKKAAEAYLPDAQYNLSWFYSTGTGTAVDKKQAADWVIKVAERGHVLGMRGAAALYRDGDHVQQDLKKARHYFQKLADLNDAEGQYGLAWLYIKGQGVAKDNETAVAWLKKSAEQGLATAQNTLGWHYQNGLGVPADLALAKQQYELAAAQGNATAKANLKNLASAANADSTRSNSGDVVRNNSNQADEQKPINNPEQAEEQARKLMESAMLGVPAQPQSTRRRPAQRKKSETDSGIMDLINFDFYSANTKQKMREQKRRWKAIQATRKKLRKSVDSPELSQAHLNELVTYFDHARDLFDPAMNEVLDFAQQHTPADSKCIAAAKKLSENPPPFAEQRKKLVEVNRSSREQRQLSFQVAAMMAHMAAADHWAGVKLTCQFENANFLK